MEQNQTNQSKQTDVITLGDICKTIWKGKIPGAIVGVLSFIIIVVGMLFVINPRKTTYQVKFQYSEVPGIDDGAYIDGERFNYRDLVSTDTVNNVIASNKEIYSSINLDKLFKKNELSIKQVYTYRDASNKDYTIVSTDYVITMPYKAFKNGAQAKSFAIDIVQIPITKTAEKLKELSYESNLIAYKNSNSYSNRLTYLNNQINLLTLGYDTWIEKQTDMLITVNGETVKLSDLKYQISNYLEEQSYSSMRTELNLNGYVYSSTEKTKLEVELANLKNELQYLGGYTEETKSYYPEELQTYTGKKENLNAQLVQLTSVTGGSANTQIISSEAFTELTKQITANDQDILNNKKQQDVINKKLESFNLDNQNASKEFGERLESIYKKISTYSETYTEVSKQLYNRNMVVFYSNSNVISSSGGYSSLIVLVAGLFVGLVLFCCVAGGYGLYLNAKEKNKKENE